MLPWKAAQIGDNASDIQTPSLVLDLDAFKRNVAKLMLTAGGIRVRPHAKSHKCPEIAKLQVQAGAVGICCQKLSEAFVFAKAGIEDILITNQIVATGKIKQLAALSQEARLGVLVDDAAQVRELALAMRGLGHALDVYVEVEVGGGRCGVPAGQVTNLAELIGDAQSLRFAGLQCYHGRAQHMRKPTQRADAIACAVDIVNEALAELTARGIDTPCVTGAGTGTFWLESGSGVYTEIQPGSYIFMDRDYADNQRQDNDPVFEHALFIQTTVMSVSHDKFCVVDAGLKAMSVDSGMPTIWGGQDLKFVKASDEHGVITLPSGQHLRLGDTLRLIPGHCDPTVNLYDDLIVVQGGSVVDIWPVSARGASL